MAVSRRNFLRNGWKAGTALLASAAAWTTWELLRPLTSNAAGGKLPRRLAGRLPGWNCDVRS